LNRRRGVLINIYNYIPPVRETSRGRRGTGICAKEGEKREGGKKSRFGLQVGGWGGIRERGVGVAKKKKKKKKTTVGLGKKGGGRGGRSVSVVQLRIMDILYGNEINRLYAEQK